MYIQTRRKLKFPFCSFLSDSFLLFSLHFPLNLNCQTNWKRKEPTHSEDPNSGASSSSNPPHGGDYEGGHGQQKGNDYEVFLSFQGKNTRKCFADYLYISLVDAGIHVLKDDESLHVGEEISLEHLHNITQCKISIPIISENYASSKWCLRELAFMLKCKRGKGQIVLPIFYNMKPFQVRHLMGRLGDAINAHKVNMDEMVVKEWEEALKEVSYLNGWELEKIDNGYEGALIKIVVEKVMSELKGTFQLVVPKDSVGIDDHVQHIMSWTDTTFDDTRIIGIYGMGGIGKTILARALYNKLSSHFKYLSFVPNIRERSHRKGIECLQKQLISDILGSPYDVSNVDEGIGVIKSRFTSKKILVLLDDVENYTHLIALVGDGSWFKAGSRVIITTRDKSILDMASVGYKYQLNQLPIDQSLFLFSRHAFQKDSPPSDYKIISLDVVSITGGLPLALEVIGSFLHGKSEEVWKDTLKKLESGPAKSVHEKLRISYDALIFEEQQIFLDIACFFVGSSKQSPIYMWESCGFFPERGITTLSLMSLIKIDEYGKLMMHDQLRDFGREIARLENLKKPQKRSRLWINEEAVDVLDNNKGTKKIEALCLDNYGRKSYTNEHFENLTNLRFLRVDGVNFIGDFKYLLPQLRWLHWQACPSDFAAVNFHLKELVVLNLSGSEISEDWGGWGPLKMATKLKVLNLSHCLSLRSTPDLSAFKSLEVFILEECLDLKEIHPSIGDIKTLISLNVRSCQGLEELPAGVGRMEELRELLLDHTNIREIPDSIGSLMSLTQLDLSHSEIEELPESIGSLMKLKTLHASYCASLAHIPSSMGNLASLCLLDLTECQKLAQLPDSIGSLVSLQRLLLRGCHSLRQIPDSIGKLTSLTELDLKSTAIEELPKSIGSLMKLKTLHASYCALLARIPNSMGNLASLCLLDLTECHKLAQLPDSIGSLVSLQRLLLRGCHSLRQIPDSIGKLTSLTELDLKFTAIEELPESIGSLMKLKTLHASYCASLAHIPSSMGNLASLCLLDLTGCNKFAQLPDSIGSLVSLQHLLLRGCHSLRQIPDSIGKLTSLTELDLKFTAIAELPENIRNLQNLRILDIHGTHMTKLPGAIGMLAEVQEWNASCCENPEGLASNISKPVSLSKPSLDKLGISGIPESIFKTSSLQMLDISEHMFAGQSLDLSSSKYLRELCVSNSKNLTEIRGLDGLEDLQVLDIFGCTSLKHSPDLSNLKNLKSLYAENCKNLVEFQGLHGLESLINLAISGCTSLKRVDLSNLKNLENFFAANCENLIEIQGLHGSESLRNLAISGCTSLRQLDLSNLKNLKNFNAACCGNLVEIRGFHGLESLRDLKISGCTSLRRSPQLSTLKNLENFYAANCENLDEIEGLDGLEFLSNLDISGCTFLRQSLDLSNLKRLKNFCAASCENLVKIRGLYGSESLINLYIAGCTSLRRLDLSNLKNLNNFCAANCENLVEIRGLHGSESLRYLDISGCKSLRQLLDLSNLKNLENFSAANCENLTEIRGLDGSESLKDLDISGWKSLRISPDLSNLKYLENFYVANCENLVEIQGLSRSESLRDLDISGCVSLRGMDLSNLKNLENLYAANCDHLVVIEGLDRLESLRDLDISGCTSLRRSLDLSNSKNLENFYAANCKNLDEIRGLDGLEFLRDLDISGCKSLKQSLDLSNLKHLWRFCAANCENLIEIQVLDGLEFLRELDISGCTSLRQSLHLSNAYLETKPLKMQREVSGPSILLPRESMEKMKDKAVQQAVDLETSDRNYAIAAAQNLVGIDDRVKQITGLLEMEVNDGVRIIGIYGTDGIGKTTLAKAVYDQISSCFDSCSFLAEVEETTQNSGGIQFLQTKLVRDILKPDREDSSFDETIELLDIFREMKVLIVVDDVEKQSHLHAIVGDRLHWFGEGSRIIVTSENEEILKEFDSGKASTYMVSPLDNGQAVELFRQHAFKMQSSWPDYDEFANLIVSATVKLPLAVEVIGSFLRGKSIEEWEKMDKSMKLFTMTSQKTTVGFEEILDICYKELDQQQKDIFLDIACFISGVDIRIASYMWPNSYLPSSDCILMPLAKIGENNELQMHRLLRCFGKRILNHEGSGDPIQRKFYIPDMVPKATSREKGMEDVEALWFDLDDHASCIFIPGDFESKPDIRFLKLDSAKLSGNFAGAFPSLRWLCWQRCPLDFDAINLVLREVVILDLSGSKITEDWGGWSEIKMEKLKVLNLTRCSDLLITPNFSNYKDLEILILERCSRLVKLDPSIGHLKRLVSLNLKFCSQLNGLPVELGGMTSLKELFIDGTSVREIPISIGNLKQLEILGGFKCFPLTYLPSSISYLTALSKLSLDGAKLTELPSSLGELLNLRRLSLRDCRYMEELPDSIGKMGSLEELDISATSISMLPNSIKNLQSLRVLRMDSSFIGAFPGEIGNLTKLEELHASRCRSLKGAIPSVIKELHHLRSLTLGHSSISSLPSEISTISGLLTLDLLQCNEIEELPKLPPSLICLRVSSKRMKAIPLLEDLKELEELCLSDGNLKSRRPSSKQPMPESYVKQMIDKPSFSILFPKLRKLELSLSQIIKLKFELTDIAHLEMLTLPGLSHEEVSELPKTLSVFELYHSAVEEIEGLEGLEALKRLDISNCKIQNLHGIGQLTSLRSLILSDCGDLSLPDLSNLKLLKVLEIRRCKMIRQIEGLGKLTSLVKLNISECPAENSVQVQNAMKHVMACSMVM